MTRVEREGERQRASGERERERARERDSPSDARDVFNKGNIALCFQGRGCDQRRKMDYVPMLVL
eukprot:6178332-Pleurochrysis_carterae.AAC.1